ncbi:uncharacterized protein LOC114520900 isoform X2 [Dendronephthya gigantea]|uniref:uncharacterized protein LOC114520900 isoform X2 n=1 Tax=Dendronephthya gigantea TaxID=151771 RepID=UPI00106CED2E|nr:uncharacterized protein LOC114520900 isoform X2 [Dendronephthya gigantea]
MEVFDMSIVKREPLDEFSSENSYLDQFMPYSNDVFSDTHSVDWLSNLVEERSGQNIDHLGNIPDYPNLVLNSLNRDQTLNSINGLPVNQRGMQDDIPTNNFNGYNGSPMAADFEHRLESGTHDLDSDMKSFYSNQPFYTQSLNSVDTIVELSNVGAKGCLKAEFTASPCDEDEGIRLSDHSDRDSESGERESHTEEINYENLVLKSCSEQGYDSGAHSPTSETPSTPPRCLMLSQGDNDVSIPHVGNVTSSHEQNQTRQPFFLSDEEKRTLITEGLPIPAGYPLTKSEERALKKVRRKIKNKISAQESRRKKKEYMETLEKRVEVCSAENLDLRKKLESVEVSNRTLISQLQKLQAIVASKVSRPTCTISTQTTKIKTS